MVDHLLPNPKLLEILGFVSQSNAVKIKLGSTRRMGRCPECGEESRKVHSRYVRCLLDLPWHGTKVEIELLVKKFFCEQNSCSRKIFTERLAGVVKP